MIFLHSLIAEEDDARTLVAIANLLCRIEIHTLLSKNGIAGDDNQRRTAKTI